jgi:hypothetical protein
MALLATHRDRVDFFSTGAGRGGRPSTWRSSTGTHRERYAKLSDAHIGHR